MIQRSRLEQPFSSWWFFCHPSEKICWSNWTVSSNFRDENTNIFGNHHLALYILYWTIMPVEVIDIYLEPRSDPCFDRSLGLLLEAWSPKIEDKQVPGMYIYIFLNISPTTMAVQCTPYFFGGFYSSNTSTTQIHFLGYIQLKGPAYSPQCFCTFLC